MRTKSLSIRMLILIVDLFFTMGIFAMYYAPLFHSGNNVYYYLGNNGLEFPPMQTVSSVLITFSILNIIYSFLTSPIMFYFFAIIDNVYIEIKYKLIYYIATFIISIFTFCYLKMNIPMLKASTGFILLSTLSCIMIVIMFIIATIFREET